MDENFRKMAEEFKVSYDQVKSELDDDSLDNAFKTAAGSALAVPLFENIAGDLDDIFLDEAFVSAADKHQALYTSGLWNDFNAVRENLEMDDAFSEASQSSVAAYETNYWGRADEALQKEGLHYEYKSTYWNDARRMLDKADRTVFFFNLCNKFV